MFTLKHLKTLQRVSIIFQTIFGELVRSLLKSLILKFVKNVKSRCGDAANRISLLILDEDKIPLVGYGVCLEVKVF